MFYFDAGLVIFCRIGQNALDGLRQVMTTLSAVVLTVLIPRLVTPPLRPENGRILAEIATVAGPALNAYIPRILTATLAGSDAGSSVSASALVDAVRTIVLALDEHGINEALEVLLPPACEEAPPRRAMALQLIADICRDTEVPLDDKLMTLIRAFLTAFGEHDAGVLQAAWGGLSAALPKLQGDRPAQLRPIMQVLTVPLGACLWHVCVGWSGCVADVTPRELPCDIHARTDARPDARTHNPHRRRQIAGGAASAGIDARWAAPRILHASRPRAVAPTGHRCTQCLANGNQRGRS